MAQVKIQNHNKPLPSSVVGGALSAAGSVVGGAINAIAQAAMAKKQRQHEKDMWNMENDAAVAAATTAYERQIETEQRQEGYNIAAEEREEQRAIDAWNRENEYNDPSAVAARYRAAGINPVAALGSGNSGAGLSGSMSVSPSQNVGTSAAPQAKTPSASVSNTMFDPGIGRAFAGAGEQIAAGIRAQRSLDIQQSVADSENKLRAEQAERERLQAESIRIDNQFKPIEKQAKLVSEKVHQDVMRIGALIDLMKNNREEKSLQASLDKIDAEIDNIEADTSLKDALKQQAKDTAQYTRTQNAFQAQVNRDYDRYGVSPSSSIPGAIVLAGTRAIEQSAEILKGMPSEGYMALIDGILDGNIKRTKDVYETVKGFLSDTDKWTIDKAQKVFEALLKWHKQTDFNGGTIGYSHGGVK